MLRRILLVVLIILGFLVFLKNDFDVSSVGKQLLGIVNKSVLALGNKSGDLKNLNSNGILVEDSKLKYLKDSGIDSYDGEIDTTYYPYYGFLSSNNKELYKQIYVNVLNMKTVFVPWVEVSVDDAKSVMEAVYNDHPEFFWLNTSYSYKYTKSGRCVQLILQFNQTTKYMNKSRQKFNASTNKIINGASNLSSDYAKEKYVHDEIIKLASYDKNSVMNQSAYSALVNGSTVCAGYARAFQYIMIKLGIPTYYCTGKSGGDHAWNIVKLDDGYYNVDFTWDDNTRISYKYFNRTDSEFASTHTRSGDSLKLPACRGVKYSINNQSNIGSSLVKPKSSIISGFDNKRNNTQSNKSNNTQSNNSNNATNNSKVEDKKSDSTTSNDNTKTEDNKTVNDSDKTDSSKENDSNKVEDNDEASSDNIDDDGDSLE